MMDMISLGLIAKTTHSLHFGAIKQENYLKEAYICVMYSFIRCFMSLKTVVIVLEIWQDFDS